MKLQTKAYLLLTLILASSVFAFLSLNAKPKRFLLITGCARSGTNYIMKVLKKSGLIIGHETVRRDGVISWLMAFDTKEVPEGDPRNGIVFEHIFHQVRHPLKVISSFHSTHRSEHPVWEYVIEQIPEIRIEDPHLVKCAKYWYYWNLKAEEEAEWTYQIEKIDQLWDEFGRRVGKKIKRDGLESIPKDANTLGSHRDFTWNDLKEQIDPDLFLDIQQLARKYGYSTED